MNSLIEQLHDIEGLDPIGWWPLALGWWVLIAIFSVVFFSIFIFLIYKIRFYLSWKNETLKLLGALEKNLTEETAQNKVVLLSEYLRRIALQLYPRKECAGLTGVSWLSWLKDHDPKKFDWETNGKILIEAPYSPIHHTFPKSQVKDLINAAKQWVR